MGKGVSKEIKKIRESLQTKEELIKYLNDIEGVPFIEELWEKANEKAKDCEGKQPPITVKTYTDKYGNVKERRYGGGTFSTNPISHYFRMMGLPYYKNKARDILNEREAAEMAKESQSEIMETYFDDDSGEQQNEIITWINMFPNARERQYLRQRYASYYDNYEINDGADRVSLSRILSLEIELYRFNMQRATGKAVDIVKEEKLTKMLRETLESMKWTKKQRSAMDDAAQNKFSIWMDKMAKNGKFTPEHHEIPKDEIDMLIEIIPQAVAKMFD